LKDFEGVKEEAVNICSQGQTKGQEGRENYMMSSFVICPVLKVLLKVKAILYRRGHTLRSMRLRLPNFKTIDT
jgi:hypothetical protein